MLVHLYECDAVIIWILEWVGSWWSEFEGDIGVELALEVFILFVLKTLVIALCFLEALCVSFAEDVVGEDALAEASVPRKRVSQLNVLLSILFNDFGIDPFVVLGSQAFPEFFVFGKSKLIYFSSRIFVKAYLVLMTGELTYFSYCFAFSLKKVW